MIESKDNIKVLHSSSCKTLSGKSTLTYQIGAAPDSAIHLRISKNSGGGYFSDEWIEYEAIQTALKKRLEGQAISSYLLDSLYVGRSSNNCSFLLASIKDLKLVQPLKGKQREFDPMDPGPFLDMVDRLMASGGTTKRAVKKAPSKKAAVKKRAAARRKKATT